MPGAERWRSPAAGSGSDVGADAGGSQVQRFVRRRFWHSISSSLATRSFLSPLALTAPCMRPLALRIMRLVAPPALPSPLAHHRATSADEPIGLVQYHWGNREPQSFGDLQVDSKLDLGVDLHGNLCRLRPLEDLVHQARRLPARSEHVWPVAGQCAGLLDIKCGIEYG